MFEERGIDYLNPNKKIILSCGSGVSVCHGYLAMKQLGRDMTEENTRIYDGSWTEWKDDPTLPKVTTS
jgi:thiosulfate/3-mercaptopyruvate sulfurtransferase